MWIKIENPDTKELNLIDLSRVENAQRSKDGSVVLWFSGARAIKLEGGKWVEVVWKELLKISNCA